MPFDIPFNPEDLISKLSDKYFAMTPQGRQQFLFGEFRAKQESHSTWVGIDYSEKKDQTIKFKDTGFSIEII
jgi:hypothetical protein